MISGGIRPDRLFRDDNLRDNRVTHLMDNPKALIYMVSVGDIIPFIYPASVRDTA